MNYLDEQLAKAAKERDETQRELKYCEMMSRKFRETMRLVRKSKVKWKKIIYF